MLGNKPTSPNAFIRRCALCGSVKLLTADNFQIVPCFAKGFSCYSNDCDDESRKRKFFISEKSKVDFVDEAECVDDGQNS